MNSFDETDPFRRNDKWAKWTAKPQRQTVITVKHVSAMIFVLTAGIQFVGIGA